MISSVADQPIFQEAHNLVAALVDHVAQSVSTLGLFEGSGLLSSDSEIRGDAIPPRNHLAVEEPNYIRLPDLADLKPEPERTPRHLSHPLVQHKYRLDDDEDLVNEINEKLTPEPILDIEDEIDDKIGSRLGPLKGIEKDIEKDVDKVVEDIYPEGRKDIKKMKWFETVNYFRWFMNLILFAFPYFSISVVMIVLNLMLNIFLNKWWAGGNFLLIFNTIYILVQTVFSWPLIFEIPFYLKHFRFVRLFSSGLAFLYTGVYAFIVLDWIVQLYMEPESTYENYQLLDILQNMFLAYSIIFHIHVLPVNLAIIIKEFLMLIFPPLLKQDQGDNLDLQDVGDAISPYTYTNLAQGKMPDQERHKNTYYMDIRDAPKN
jgi:hypothetical protein